MTSSHTPSGPPASSTESVHATRLMRALRVARAATSGAKAAGEARAAALAWIVRLLCMEKFSPDEVTAYRLYLACMRQQHPVLISKERSLEKLQRFNPVRDLWFTENKAAFYVRCRAFGLPIPENLGFFKKGAGWNGDLVPVSDKARWLAYFRTSLPGEFIIKANAGAYGQGFAAFQRHGDSLEEIGVGLLSMEAFYERLTQASHGGAVLQERLHDHPDLQALSGIAGLQCLRINTLLETSGPRMLFYRIKLLGGHTLTDNFSFGRTGNLIAYGERDRGVLTGAVTRQADGAVGPVKVHPVSKRRLTGFVIPFWREAVDLVLNAHRCFPELGTLGWDIAVTRDGPLILEANALWDPPTYAPHILRDEDWHRIFG